MMMFEPRSRGFSEPLPDQSFCGWLCALQPGDFFGARPLPAVERGLGWGQVAAPADGNRVLPSRAREQAVSSSSRSAWLGGRFAETCDHWLTRSHHFQNLISLIPRRLPRLTHRNPATPPYPGIGASAPTKGIIIMKTTRAQIKANRNTAKKSTGPRTEEGKAGSAKNALKHGLLARDTVLPGEDPADFDRQLSALEADIQPANSLEFELVRQIADAQWRMRRLTRLETGFLAAALADKRRLTEKYHPERLRPGYDGETLLFGSAMIDQTQALVHLARYDGHLSRRFFHAVKQLADLRRDERKSRETRSSANSYTAADSYPGRYVPVQAPPPIDTPSPTAGRIGFRASRESGPQAGLRGGQGPARQTTLTKTTKQTQFRRTLVESTRSNDEPRSVDLAFEIRGLCSAPPPTDNASPSGAASPHRTGNQHSGHMKASDSFVAHAFLRAVSPFVATSSPFVAHALSVPRRDSSRRLVAVQPQTTKQTQSRQTPVESMASKSKERLGGEIGRDHLPAATGVFRVGPAAVRPRGRIGT